MNKLLSLSLLTVLACNTVKTGANDAIDCAKAEASLIESGKSVLDVASDVATAAAKVAIAFATGGAAAAEAELVALTEPLIAHYGEQIVACTFEKVAPTLKLAAGSNAAPQVDVRQLAFAHYGWRLAK